MKLLLSVHMPGLNLNEARILHHKLFLNAIEHNILEIGAAARALYRERGRGVLFVSQDDWMQVIRSATRHEADRHQHGTDMRFAYYQAGAETVTGGIPRFAEHLALVSAQYDAEQEFVLAVHHRTVDVRSLYWFSTEPAAPVRVDVEDATCSG